MSFSQIGVVGAGMMGAEIALCFARFGYEIIMADREESIVIHGKDRQAALLNKQVSRGKLTEGERDGILNRIQLTCDLSRLSDCDLVVEAVLEIPEVKSEVYRQLDASCKPACILASNTSSISITKLAAAVTRTRAGNFIGTHFNSPAGIMKLVEVVPGILTEEKTTDAVFALLQSIEKEPVRVKDVTGFALNRLFHVFTAEACRLVEEGVCSLEDVDKICLHGLGHPMGVFKLLDILGNDLNLRVDTILYEAYGERFRPGAFMQRLVDAGLYGKKVGEGFYKYPESRDDRS